MRHYRGERNGGVHEAKGCEGLPPNLQGGCYWRFNWGGGDMLGWDIQYRQVECPERLTSLSGCNNRPRQT